MGIIAKSIQEIKDAGFQYIQGSNAWYYPEGPEGKDQPNTTPRIHIGGSVTYGRPDVMEITFVSIGPHGSGQPLSWNPGNGKWALDTPGINWRGYKGELSNVLTTLGIAS